MSPPRGDGSFRVAVTKAALKTALIVAVLVLTSWSAARAALEDPPPGLVPPAVSFAHVRTLYDRAHPLLPHARIAPIIEEWHVVQDGMSGMSRTRRFGRESRTILTLGPFVTESGTHAGVRWQQTRNGMTFVMGSGHDPDAVSEHAFLTAGGDRSDVRLIGESPAFDAYVIDVNPAGGRHEWLFIDRRTGETVRTERIERKRRYAVTYDEFRAFDGDLQATRVRTIDSLGNERLDTLISRSYDTTLDLHAFDIPPNRRTLVEFPGTNGPVRLPTRLVNGLWVVRTSLNGKPADFLLDSGAAGIVVDLAFADSLGLERYGSHINSSVGNYVETSSIAAQMTVGTLRLSRVAVRVLPITFKADAHTKIAGLLGFDFLADAALHMNYDRAAVFAYAPGKFRAPDGMTAVPIALDDKTPAVRARIGGAIARMRLDTGANRTLLFSAFADRADVGGVKLAAVGRYLGVGGGSGRGQLLRLHSIDFANSAIADPLVEVSYDDFALENADGLLGSDILRGFDLWIDYRSGDVFVRRSGKTPLRLAG